MKERPILFSGPMVRALLAGSKTQTRRALRTQPPGHVVDFSTFHNPKGDGLAHFAFDPVKRELQDWFAVCPYGQPGDRLWVRETWQGPLLQEHEIDADPDWHYPSNLNQYKNPQHCEYAADGGPKPEYTDADDVMRQGWRPSIHMPRWASRITLEITSVRVERLQDISEADSQAEGATPIPDHCDHVRLSCADIGCSGPQPYRVGFRSLWQSINGPASWDANPWVWAVEFRKVTP